MSIDTYAPCPGGTGKKIKFCCADLVGDLEQLDRLIEGDQLSAALDQVQRLEEKHRDRACLMATRVKLELAAKQFSAAADTSRRFLEACPTNPVALGQAAVTDAVAGRVQEAAALFDKARGAAGAAPDVLAQLARIAATLVQAGAQSGHVGFAQGLVDWIVDRSLAAPEEIRMLAAIVGSAGVPPALRTRVPLAEAGGDTAWQADFDLALGHSRAWRLAQALTGFRSLKGVAGESREVFTNIAVLCEMLARPIEASEAWSAVARIRDVPRDEAVEAEADPDRSPQIRFASITAQLAVPAGEEGVTALELLEDTLRHDTACETAGFDRSAWVSRGAVPPRSVWRVYERPVGDTLPRLLASLLLFGRQTDREPEAVLQGFAPDVSGARLIVEPLLRCTFSAVEEIEGMPTASPTEWLLNAQFRLPVPTTPPPPPAAGEPSLFDTLMARQRSTVRERFVAEWPETALPELLGRTPRAALGDVDGARRVEALVAEGEATSRRGEIVSAWMAIRERLGIAAAQPIESVRPLDEVSPLQWHRLDMAKVPLDELRGVLVTSLEAGFERAAERAAEALLARSDATPEDRWEALGVLEERAESSTRKLEIIAELRGLARTLKASMGMLDVAELRVRMQRGDQAETVRLMETIRRDHGRDSRVIQALAQVLMEAGIDIGALAGRPTGATPPPTAGATPSAAPEVGKLWTPGGEQSDSGGEKKVIWTPG